MADGSIRVETKLDTDGVEAGLDDIEKMCEDTKKHLEETGEKLKLDAKLSVDTSEVDKVTDNVKSELEKIAQKGSQKTINGVNVANIRTKNISKKQIASIKAMGAISDVTNGSLKMVAYESKADVSGAIREGNGWYDSGTNTLYFDINAGIDNINRQGDLDRAILRTGGHELTHFIQRMSPEYYDGLKGFIVDTLNSADPNGAEILITAKMNAFKDLSYDEALDEVIADSCEMLLKDSKAIKKLAKENMTLAQKVKAWIDDFVKNIKKAFEGVSAKSHEAKLLEQILGDMTELQKVWDEALEDALRTSKVKGTENGTQGEVDVDNNSSRVYSNRSKYDEYASFSMKWANEADRKEGDMKVFSNKGRDFRLLEADGNGGFVELARGNFKKVSSVYERSIRETDSSIRRDIEAYGLDKRRHNGDRSVRGGQPGYNGRNNSTTSGERLQSNSSGNNEHNRSSNKGKSVKYSDRIYLDAVESGDMETAQRMVDEAAEQSMPDSIIRDESGKLLTVYHGSPGKFTVFSHNKMNTNGNAHGRGFYFTEEKSMAEGYKKDGGQLLKGYLNITNPMSEEKVTIKKSDLTKYIKATCIQEANDLVADGSYDTVNEALPDTWISNYVYTYGMNINDAYREVVDIIYNNDNDVDIIAEISNVVGTEIALKKAHEVLGYDGVIYTNDRGTHEYIALISNQFKSAETTTYDDNGDIIPLSKRFDQDNADVRFSKRNYSYDALISKPDMKVTMVDDTKKYEPSKETRNHITNEAIKNAASVGHTNENGNAVVYVKDIDTDVIVPKRSIVHGLDRRLNTQSPVLVKIGEVLESSIKINELIPRGKNIENSYALIGFARSEENEYIISFVVNRFTNEVSSIDVLYAVNAKKESAALLPKITENSVTPTDSTISISNLLDYVNKYFPDILPEDVLKHYGRTERPEGSLGKDILFSYRSTQFENEGVEDISNFTHRELLRNALSTVAQNETERDFLARYQREIKDVEKKYEEVAKLRRQIHDISFTKGSDRSQLPAIKNRVAIIEDQIQRADKKLNGGKSANGLVKGCTCTVSQVKDNWGKIPSGWICLDYCERVD